MVLAPDILHKRMENVQMQAQIKPRKNKIEQSFGIIKE